MYERRTETIDEYLKEIGSAADTLIVATVVSIESCFAPIHPTRALRSTLFRFDLQRAYGSDSRLPVH